MCGIGDALGGPPGIGTDLTTVHPASLAASVFLASLSMLVVILASQRKALGPWKHRVRWEGQPRQKQPPTKTTAEVPGQHEVSRASGSDLKVQPEAEPEGVH